MKYKECRHSRAGGNPSPDVWQTMCYQGLFECVLDSCLRGNDGTELFGQLMARSCPKQRKFFGLSVFH